VDASIIVRNSGAASSLRTHLLIEIPPELQLVGVPYYERGSGCAGSQHVDCYLDFIQSDSQTRIAFQVQTVAPGAATITATASADSESDLSDNAAAVTVDVAAPETPTAITPVIHTVSHTFSGGARADRMTGTAGADLIYGRGGNDTLRGGSGNDVLNGGPGNDVLYGGAGLDRLYGGPGTDILKARDGERDVVDCGPGRDTAYVDRHDRVSGCERVIRN
jgi:hypothetical protein